MPSPLYEALKTHQNQKASAFHMPGHKGILPPPLDGIAPFDVTELPDTDTLYAPTGPLAECEQAYSNLYGSKYSLLSAGGGTLCIQAMMAYVKSRGGYLGIARGAHQAAVHAMALLDITPAWLWPGCEAGSAGIIGLPKQPTPGQVHTFLNDHPVDALYLTSPDYAGQMADIQSIAAICREQGVPLLVDNAHGAHLHFLSPSQHPLTLGASMTADSLHKTLPVLTGGAVLHVADYQGAPSAGQMRNGMSLFGTTSPSFAILLSIDRALPVLQDEFAAGVEHTARYLKWLKDMAAKKGFSFPQGQTDPLKFTFGLRPFWANKGPLETFLQQHKIAAEYISELYGVFMLSPYNTEEEMMTLMHFIEDAPAGTLDPLSPCELPHPKAVLSLREALLRPSVELPLLEAMGRISAQVAAPCPPGIPILMPGEIIDAFSFTSLRESGIQRIFVVK